MGANEGGFPCMGGHMGKDINFGSTKERWRCFLCHNEEEFVDHILIHCIKTRVLWQLLFFFFQLAMGAFFFG